MTPHQVELLQDLLRRESRSLLQYVAESYPWSKTETADTCDRVRAMAQAQAEIVARIARWLSKQHVPVPLPGAYPMSFTTGNFSALHYLIPRLIADEGRCTAAADEVLLTVTDDDARKLLRELVVLKQQHELELTALQARTSPAALAS